MPRRPWPRRSLTLLGGAVLWLLLLAHPAAAHAVLVGSEPADGVTLAHAPGTVRLRFSEDISARFSSARLVDRSGRTVAGTRVITARGDPRLLVLELPALETGAYGVLWQVLAEYDGHTTSGAVVFSVGEGSGRISLPRAAAAGGAAVARPADVARRWIGVSLLAGLIGALAVAGLVLGRPSMRGEPAPPEPNPPGPDPPGPDPPGPDPPGHPLGVPRTPPALGVPRTPPGHPLGVPRTPPALGVPRTPPALGVPRTPPALGVPRTPPAPPRVKTGAAHPAEAIAVAIRTARRRILTFAAGCAALGVVAGVVDALAEAARQAPATGRSPATAIQFLSATRWGHLWLVREAALLVLAFLALALRPAIGRPRRGWDRALATGAGALIPVVVSVEAIGSHAAALDSARAAAVAAGALHVLTACLWLGALPALVLMMWPQRRGAAGPADLLMASRGPLTGLAASSLGLVVVTGLYSAGREVETVDGLVTTPYGRALLVKSTLLLVVGGLGLVNASRLHGLGRRIAASWPSRLEWRSSTRGARRDGFPSPQASGARHRPLTTTLVIMEAGAGALLLLVVGVLLESAPARGAVRPLAAPTPAAAETGSGSVADLVVTVSVTPNRPGMNGFTALAASSRRPPPAPVESVALELARGGDSSAVVLQQVAPGRWFGTGRLEQGGSLQLEAVVRRAGKRLAVPVPWSVGPPVLARQAVAPEGRRLAPYVNVMALSLLAGGLALAVAWLLREGRR